jgi:Bacterial SH3 domain
VRRSLDGILRLRSRALLWACLLILVVGPLRPGVAAEGDPLGLEAAASEVRAALEDMTNALNGAPRQVQTTIGTDLHLMRQAIARALDRLEGEGAAVADPTLVYDLNFLADVAHAATDELHAIAARPGLGLDPERAQRVARLTDAAAARLNEINLVLDGWSERSRNALIKLEDDGGVLVVRSTDKLIYNGVRYVSIALLAVGLLAVGLQLLRTGQEAVDARARPRRSPLRSGLAGAALAAFFASCVAFSLRPGMLAALSAEVRVQAPEQPCERLAAERDRLIAAQQADHPGLIEATKQRMRPAAQDCLGLPSKALAAEAVERLASKTALALNEPMPARRPSVGTAAAEAGATDATVATPPEVAELKPSETQMKGGLAGLLAGLRDNEEATASDPTAPAAAPRGPAAGPLGPPARPPGDRVSPAVVSVTPAATALESAAPAADHVSAAAEPVGPPAGTPEHAPEQVEPAAGPAPTAAPEAPPEAAPSRRLPERKPTLFVTTAALNYREGPSVDARRLGTLVPGTRLQVLGEDAGWAEVRLADGSEAYVASEFLEPAR